MPLKIRSFVCRSSIMIIGRADSERRDAARLPVRLNLEMEYLTRLIVNRFNSSPKSSAPATFRSYVETK